jgi:DNA polymerase-3 subunit gamma/tau
LLRDLVVLRIAPEGSLVEGSVEEIAELREIAAGTEPARLRRMFRALLKEQEDLTWAPQPFAVLEMAVVRLATMPAGDDVHNLLSRIDAMEKRLLSGGGGSAPGDGGGSRTAARSGGSAQPRPARPRARTESAGAPAEKTAAEPRSDEHQPSTPQAGAPRNRQRPNSAQPNSEPRDFDPAPPAADAPLPVIFDRLRANFRKADPGLSGALDGGRLVACTEGKLRFEVPRAFAARRLEDRRETFEKILERFFGRPITFAIETEGVEKSAASGADPEALRALRQHALNNPGVNAALDVLQGEIVEIRPLGGSTGGGG